MLLHDVLYTVWLALMHSTIQRDCSDSEADEQCETYYSFLFTDEVSYVTGLGPYMKQHAMDFTTTAFEINYWFSMHAHSRQEKPRLDGLFTEEI